MTTWTDAVEFLEYVAPDYVDPDYVGVTFAIGDTTGTAWGDAPENAVTWTSAE